MRPSPWSPARRLVPWAVSSALVALLGCGGSRVCTDYADTQAEVAREFQPCGEQVPLPAFEAQRCEKNLGACDEKDRMQLEAQRACYARLDTCQPDQKDVFLQAITDCDALSVSNACEAAIF